MKRLSFALGALVLFFFGNLGITSNLDSRLRASSSADVCDCGTICKMHLTCDVPKCNGRVAQENGDHDNDYLNNDSPDDEGDENL